VSSHIITSIVVAVAAAVAAAAAAAQTAPNFCDPAWFFLFCFFSTIGVICPHVLSF